MQAVQGNLVRKQIMLSNDNIEKLEKIAEQRQSSVAEVVRIAVDAYNPNDDAADMDETELYELVSAKLKEVIKDTAKTRKRLNKTLTQLEEKNY